MSVFAPPVRVLVNGLHAKSGGGVTYLRNILPFLADDRRLELHLFLKRDQYALFHPVDERVRVHLFDFGEGLARLLAWEQLVLPLLARLMAVDVTFSPANFGPLLAPRPVIMLRNSLAVVGRETRSIRRLYWVGLALMTALSLLSCRQAIAVSEYARRALTFGLRGVLHGRVTVVPHGLSTHFAAERDIDDKESFLLAVADIYVQKNLHNLIEALPRIVASRPEVRLLIAGREIDGSYAAELRQLVTRLHLGDRVEFMGGVSSQRLKELYNACALFVFPSTVETFGNPLVEAMACGACIASSNTAAMPEILADAGCYFDPLDVDDIAGQILKLLGDREMRRDFSARALLRAGNFSWRSTGDKTAEVLTSVVRGDKRGRPR
ncbi:MAG: glycosyltransferase family 4 protein [Alphaproteobacteria bacterium]